MNKTQNDATVLYLSKEALELSMKLVGTKTVNYFNPVTKDSKKNSSKATTLTLKSKKNIQDRNFSIQIF